MYGMPKLHKVSSSNALPPFRPIVSSIGTYNYKLAKYLCDLLTPLIPAEHCAKDTFTFVEDIKKVRCSNYFMVSFDVESLFTNVPLSETIDIAVNLIFQNFPEIKITDDELRQLFIYATKETHFLFDSNMYDQIDGVAMGSPLGPALANLFMGHHECNWLNAMLHPMYYSIEDMLMIFSACLMMKGRLMNFFNTSTLNILLLSLPAKGS